MQVGISPVHVGRTLESLRNSNFNTVSAMGEVIDNSLEAEAENVRIEIKKEETRRNRFDLIEVAFGDDGMGMDKSILHQCLQLGFSIRYNNRKGIGRFGVGMTLGAITQCTRIEVYSKPKGGEWNLTYLDLDEMKDQSNPIIPEPTHKTIPKEYSHLIGDNGTLVIWKNWDREDATIEQMIEWIGRTYRKFIGEEIIKEDKVIPNPNRRYVFLNGKEISAFDPLYVTKTKYNSEVAILDLPIKLQEEIHQFDQPPEKPSGQSEIVIRMSLLPENWRPKRGTGDSAENKARLVNKNEGISILRNDREVFYGSIPYYQISDKKQGRGFLDLDRFWGCEIAFNANLDHWFSVKNIKVGARPLTELREKIEDAINDTIHSYRKEIRDVWDKYTTEQNIKTKGVISDTDDAESALKKNNPTKPSSSKETDIDEILKAAGETQEEIITELRQKMSDRPFTFLKSDKIDRRGNFIDIASRGDTVLITLNMNHPFFQEFFDILKKLSEKGKELGKDDEITEMTNKMQTILLLFLGTFAAAQKEFNRDQAQTAGDFIDKLIHNWTFHLEKNVGSLKDKN